MYKYIALKYPEYEVDSIIEVEDINTMDNIIFPDNLCIFIPAKNYDVLPNIGQIYNPETQTFE